MAVLVVVVAADAMVSMYWYWLMLEVLFVSYESGIGLAGGGRGGGLRIGVRDGQTSWIKFITFVCIYNRNAYFGGRQHF
jgi:hypothetical protein